MGSQFDAESAPFKVLILGGCYGGLAAALNLVDLSEGRAARTGNGVLPGHDGKIPIDITIVDERDGYYHLIGSPLALADEDYAAKAWVKYEDMPALKTPKITFIQAKATNVDPSNKRATVLETATQNPKDLTYDYLIVATGLRRAWPVVPQSLWRKQYLLEAGAHINAVTNSPAGVVVVGGGAVGIEMAAELKAVRPETRVTLVHSRDKLLSSEPLPDECKDKALDLVRESGVEVLLGKRLAGTEEVTREGAGAVTEVTFTDGEKMDASVVIMAISKAVPSTEFLPKEALQEEGLVKARADLRFPVEVPNSDVHFAIGDAIKWSGIKRCGGAMHMGFFAAHNIHELVLEKLTGAAPKFRELDEVPPMIGLAVGKKAMSYGPDQGVCAGEDVMKVFFGDDLGWSICWNYMKLGEEHGLPKGSLVQG
ncbi:oxidoreductase [Diaporthe amygdali]|uniref:oxidoreductase n=1 Tax=Phomopsis amygdali TaxID=1214568 RepID=UPI0022FE9D76|nr:oxidoreductase [Diaporthe amygdali]KAJ0122719.1 oxidoreductase [Diaporthe amygdali]